MPISDAPWPAFTYDANAWFGNVDDVETFQQLVEASEASGRDGLDHVLNACFAGQLRTAGDYVGSYDAETVQVARQQIAMEVGMVGDRPNFGWRREHSGDVTLGEWLREHGVSVVPVDWRPARGASVR